MAGLATSYFGADYGFWRSGAGTDASGWASTKSCCLRTAVRYIVGPCSVKAAEVVKLVDALRSGRSSRMGVGVRVPPSAPPVPPAP